MHDYWMARRDEANRKMGDAPGEELRLVYQELAGHYRAMARKSRCPLVLHLAGNECSAGVRFAA